MKEQKPTYLEALTFPRFILAMLVVIVHFGLHLPFFKESVLSEMYHYGAVAVSFFFFLSGFVLAYNYKKGVSPKSFLLKRLFRLYPTYLITFLIVLTTVYLVEGNAPTVFHSIANMLGLQSWFPGYALQVNFPSWSLSVEFFFYLCFPIILWLYYKLPLKYFLSIALIIIIAGGIEHYIAVTKFYDSDRYFLEQFILYFPLFHFSTFVAGFLCGKWIHWLKTVRITSWFYTLIAILGIIGFILIMNSANFYRPFTHNGGLIPIFALICIGLALDKQFFYYLFGWKPLKFLGEISYGIYMWQFPVYLAFKYSLEETEFSPSIFLAYTAVLLTWSSLAYLYFEKPTRKYLSKKFISN